MELHSDQVDEATGAFCSMAPDPADVEHWDRIAEIEHRLTHAGGAHDLAWDLDLALLVLEQEALGARSRQLDTEEHNRLLKALSNASARAYRVQPRGIGQEQAVAGILVMAHTLEYWALPDAVRASRGKLRHHLRSLLRIFRNALHSACLLDNLVDDLAVMAPWQNLGDGAQPDLESVRHLLGHPLDAVSGFVRAYSARGKNAA
jgi:hypothetical protein